MSTDANVSPPEDSADVHRGTITAVSAVGESPQLTICTETGEVLDFELSPTALERMPLDHLNEHLESQEPVQVILHGGDRTVSDITDTDLSAPPSCG